MINFSFLVSFTFVSYNFFNKWTEGISGYMNRSQSQSSCTKDSLFQVELQSRSQGNSSTTNRTEIIFLIRAPNMAVRGVHIVSIRGKTGGSYCELNCNNVLLASFFFFVISELPSAANSYGGKLVK